jgi:cation:H+ antiporter
MNFLGVLGFVGGLFLLVMGAELLVRGASRLALTLGIAPLVVGLTVVAFGTSAPEMAVSLQAALEERPDLALGNVVGSNIFNVLFILGISALITPLAVHQKLVRLEVPLLILTSVLLFTMALDGRVGRLEGGFLFLGVLGYTAFLVVQSRREEPEIQQEYAEEFGVKGSRAGHLLVQGALVAGGLALLVAGSNLLLESAVSIARALGVSELMIGLTLVAAGTSLPEVATSVVAAIRGKRDIAVGNVVGSNLFNVLAVLGLSATVSSGVGVTEQAIYFDIPVMIAVSLVCLPVFFTGGAISRWEGLVLLAGYGLYLTYLYLHSGEPWALELFTQGFYLVVVPLAALGLILSVAAEIRTRRQRSVRD